MLVRLEDPGGLSLSEFPLSALKANPFSVMGLLWALPPETRPRSRLGTGEPRFVHQAHLF